MTGATRLQTAGVVRWTMVAGAAVTLVVAGLLAARVPSDLPRAIALVLVLAAAGALVHRGPLPFARDGRVPSVGWVVLAAALLLDPAAAALAAAAGPLLAAAWHRRDPAWAVPQAGRAALQAAVAALVLAALGWDPDRPLLDRPWPLLALLPAFAAAYLAGGLAARWSDGQAAPRLRLSRALAPTEILTLATQLSLAVIVTGLAATHAWMLALVLLAAAAMTRALGRQEQLRLRAEDELAHRAFHDALTGLPNRVLFEERLAAAFARARREGTTFAVLFLDLDRFKLVNDTLGHPAGDRFLVAMADRLRACVRPGDTVARIGGDEFTVLLERVRDRAEAEAIAARITGEVSGPVAFGDHEAAATASVGVALPTAEHREAADLLRDADAALYRAKDAGRAGFAVYEPGMAAEVGDRLRLEADLRRAVTRGELLACYQPRVELASGRTVAVEATAWWDHPERGILPPGAFRRAADETGLVGGLDRWLLATAIAQAATWRATLVEPPAIVVPLAARWLCGADIAAEVAHLLAGAGLPPDRLRLEVRDVVAGDPEQVRAAVGRLRRAGVAVTTASLDDVVRLDDPGRWPIPAPRLEASLVARLDRNPEALALARGIVALAAQVEALVLADGVTTVDQVAILRSLGCDLAQGPFFSDPVPGEALGVLLVAASGGGETRPGP